VKPESLPQRERRETACSTAWPVGLLNGHRGRRSCRFQRLSLALGWSIRPLRWRIDISCSFCLVCALARGAGVEQRMTKKKSQLGIALIRTIPVKPGSRSKPWVFDFHEHFIETLGKPVSVRPKRRSTNRRELPGRPVRAMRRFSNAAKGVISTNSLTPSFVSSLETALETVHYRPFDSRRAYSVEGKESFPQFLSSCLVSAFIVPCALLGRLVDQRDTDTRTTNNRRPIRFTEGNYAYE